MVICFFGYPNESYSRNAILIDGLKKNHVQIISCTDKSGLFVTRYWKLFTKFLDLKNKTDIIFVQFPGQLNMPIAWVLGKLYKKPVIFDAFVSMYDTYVFDREIAKPESIKAKFYWWVDKLACTLADKITLDTHAHIRYFVKTFKLNRLKFFRLPVGGDDTLFKPRHKHSALSLKQKLVVEFHGMFTKIHGTEIFIKVAKSLENQKNLEFWLIGDNPGYRYPVELYRKLKPKNMKYWSSLPIKKLAQKVRQADISVGHLGPTQKSRMVLTNKMFHALSSRVALIAGNSPASREFLVHRQTAYFVKLYDENSLKHAILKLAKNHHLRFQIARSGYKLHQSQFTNKKLGLELLQVIREHSLHITPLSGTNSRPHSHKKSIFQNHI